MSTATISNSASVTWEFTHSAAASHEQLGVAAWETFEKSRLPELQALYLSGRYADLADAILDSFVLDEPHSDPEPCGTGFGPVVPSHKDSHICVLTAGHDGGHRCPCGATSDG